VKCVGVSNGFVWGEVSATYSDWHLGAPTVSLATNVGKPLMRFNARGPDGLLDGKSPGQPPKFNDEQRHAIAGLIESDPIPSVHGVARDSLRRRRCSSLLSARGEAVDQ
jgi:hypothetical protein